MAIVTPRDLLGHPYILRFLADLLSLCVYQPGSCVKLEASPRTPLRYAGLNTPLLNFIRTSECEDPALWSAFIHTCLWWVPLVNKWSMGSVSRTNLSTYHETGFWGQPWKSPVAPCFKSLLPSIFLTNSWGIPWAYKRAVRHQRAAALLEPSENSIQLDKWNSKWIKVRLISPLVPNHSSPWTTSATFTRLFFEVGKIIHLPRQDLLFYSSLSAMTSWGTPSGDSMLYTSTSPSSTWNFQIDEPPEL